MCVPGLSGKMWQETEREREEGWHWSSFYTDAYCMTHSFATGRVRVWVCTRLRALRCVVLHISLCTHCAFVCVCVCECLTWFVAQCVSNFLWDAIFNHLKHLPWAYTVDMLHLTHTASYIFHFQSGVCNASLVGTQNRTKINGRVTLVFAGNKEDKSQ